MVEYMTKIELDMMKIIDEMNERKIRKKLLRFVDGFITFLTAAGVFLAPFILLIICKIFMK